jgi:hypothetical protein
VDGTYQVKFRDYLNRTFQWSTNQETWSIPSIAKNFTSDNDKSGPKYMLGTEIVGSRAFADLTVPKKGIHYYSFPEYNMFVN